MFQDRFRSEVIHDDRYLLAAARYIHNNPVKAGLVDTPDKYKWSSFINYLPEADLNDIVDIRFLLKLFSENKEKAIKAFLSYSKEKCEDKFIDIEQVESKEFFNKARGFILPK